MPVNSGPSQLRSAHYTIPQASDAGVIKRMTGLCSVWLQCKGVLIAAIFYGLLGDSQSCTCVSLHRALTSLLDDAERLGA